ncbi:MAG: type II toxin-antitoxin system VapC family toxin [Chloroflexi bacterium]|nr:type II toxin-antitoxin system VapC family toxin [Chloroflexota bacterium]
MISVDASLAAKWILAEAHSEQALALVSGCARSGDRMVAPPLLPFEMTNIVRRQMLRGGLSLAEARALLNEFSAFPVYITSAPLLSDRALTIAANYNLPATYDAHYVALAELLGCDLWTDDRRLLRLLGGALPFVKWIGDYPLG